MAAYRAEILKADVPNEVRDSLISESAPVEMRFFDESKGNVTQWSWMLGISGYSIEKNPFYVFTEARTDSIVLTVSNDVCESVNDSLKITVMESQLEFPNAFTPNGDGINDEFRCAYRSLKKYQITIVNRWGRIVYTSNDPAKGWDGNIGNNPAPPGVYFFYAEAEGYRKGEKHKKRGPIHLIRGK